MKEKIIIGCILIGVLMTIFPPQQVHTIQNLHTDPTETRVIDNRVEYHFIGSSPNSSIPGIYNQSNIAFERLLLQYLILIGVGYAIYITVGKKDGDN